MRYLLAILLISGFYMQNNHVYSQETYNKKVKVESYFNMDTTLGVIFCGKLNHLVYNAALQGKIPVYKTSDLKPEEKLNKDQVFAAGGKYHFPDIGGAIIDTVHYDLFRVQDIVGYYFSINWQLDTNGYFYSAIPDAFSFAYKSTDEGHSIISSLFWISISDLKTLITTSEFHQLQESIFLHIYTSFEYTTHDYWIKESWIEDFKNNSYQKNYFNYRLFPEQYSKQLLSINKRLYDDAIYAKMLVYENDSMQFGSIISKEKILRKGSNEYMAQIKLVEDGPLIDTLIIEPFKTDSIKGNSVTELWEIDYLNNKIIIQITGISVDWEINLWGQDLGRRMLFCVPYKYVESVIGKAELHKMSNILFNSLVKNYLEK